MNHLEIVKAALSAPTGDNCQPFSFSWHENDLSIWFNPDRARHFMDVGLAASLLSLGATIEAAAIGASAYGMAPAIELQLPLKQEKAIAATLKFVKSAIAIDPLQPHLLNRATDRRCYQGGYNHEVFTALAAEAAAYPTISYATTSLENADFIEQILHADSIVFSHRDAQQDLMRWLRLSDDEIAAHRDGMPWTTLGIKPHELLFLRACRRWWVQSLSNKIGGLKIARQVLKKQILSSARLIGLGVKTSAPNSIVEAGRIALRIWVRLNADGFGVQSLSALPLFTFAASTGSLPELNPGYAELFESAVPTFRRVMGWSDQITPLWLFRTGITTPLAPRMRCPRLRPDEVVVS